MFENELMKKIVSTKKLLTMLKSNLAKQVEEPTLGETFSETGLTENEYEINWLVEEIEQALADLLGVVKEISNDISFDDNNFMETVNRFINGDPNAKDELNTKVEELQGILNELSSRTNDYSRINEAQSHLDRLKSAVDNLINIKGDNP